jgi:hypothetical protein
MISDSRHLIRNLDKMGYYERKEER